MPRTLLVEHSKVCPYRGIKCDKCRDVYKFINTETHMTEKCNGLPKTCECGHVTTKGRYDSHRKQECGHYMVDCKYSKFGCTNEFKRMKRDSHYDDNVEYHLQILADFIESHYDGIVMAQEKYDKRQ